MENDDNIVVEYVLTGQFFTATPNSITDPRSLSSKKSSPKNHWSNPEASDVRHRDIVVRKVNHPDLVMFKTICINMQSYLYTNIFPRCFIGKSPAKS